MVHHTKTKGDIGVAKVIADLTEKEFSIFIPLSEHLPFDLVAYKDTIFYRMQIKYRTGNPIFIPNKTSWSDKNGNHTKNYDINDFDYFGIYIADTDKIIYPSISFASKNIRIKLPSTFCSFYWYEDFLDFTTTAKKRKLKDLCAEEYKNIIEKKKIETKLRKMNKPPNPNRPTKEELGKLLWTKPTVQIAKDFSVSDKAVEKWAKDYDLSKPPRGYWRKLQTQNLATADGFEPSFFL